MSDQNLGRQPKECDASFFLKLMIEIRVKHSSEAKDRAKEMADSSEEVEEGLRFPDGSILMEEEYEEWDDEKEEMESGTRFIVKESDSK